MAAAPSAIFPPDVCCDDPAPLVIVEALEAAAIAAEMVGVTTAFSADTVCMESPSSVDVTGSFSSKTWNIGLPNCGLAAVVKEKKDMDKTSVTVPAVMNVERKRTIMINE